MLESLVTNQKLGDFMKIPLLSAKQNVLNLFPKSKLVAAQSFMANYSLKKVFIPT